MERKEVEWGRNAMVVKSKKVEWVAMGIIENLLKSLI